MVATKKSDGKVKENQMFSTSVDIPEDKRAEIISLLNQSLADVFDLYSQTKQAHWNVKGSDFIQFHLFFDQLAEMVYPFIDMIAERVTALGGTAKGTARMSADNSSLAEFPNVHGGMQCVETLIQRYGNFANSSRENIDKTEKLEDMATNDLYIEIVRVLDKALWFLEAHIQA